MQSSVQSVKICESEQMPGRDDSAVHPETETGKNVIDKIADGVTKVVDKVVNADNSGTVPK